MSETRKLVTLTICILVCCNLHLTAQETERFGDGGPQTAYKEPEVDTIQVASFTLADLSKLTTFNDSLLNDFEKYADARKFETAALTLGNLGSSHLRIRYEPRPSILTIAGFSQYKNYQLELNDFNYYVVGSAFNDLYFTPVAGQENFKVQAKFSNNFDNNINVSLDLKRINQDGFYSDQTTKSTAFGFGLWKHNKEKNRQTFFTFLANNNNEVHNGGIVSPSEFRVRIQEDSYLQGTNSRHQNFKYALDNFFNIKSDKYYGHHQIVLEDGYFHYGDDGNSTTSDSTIYKTDFITNEAGIRYYLDMIKVKNNFDLSFDTKSFGLKLGLIHQWAKFTNDQKSLKTNDIIIYSDMNIGVGEFAFLDARGELGLGSNAGNINLSAELSLKPTKGLNLKGSLKLLRYDPTIIQRFVSVSNSLVFENDFSKTNELKLGAQLGFEKLNIQLAFNSGVITDPISYNTLAKPIQKDGSTEYFQATVVHKLRWRFIGIENSVCYQEFSDNIYRLPDLYSIHNAYLEFPMFRKNLLTRIGGLYYFTRFRTALEFFPITGSFIPSEEGLPQGPTMNKYPYMEAYANFKIKSFRLFVKIENLHDLINPFAAGLPHYQILNYPQFDWKLRFGVRWLLRQ